MEHAAGGKVQQQAFAALTAVGTKQHHGAPFLGVEVGNRGRTQQITVRIIGTVDPQKEFQRGLLPVAQVEPDGVERGIIRILPKGGIQIEKIPIQRGMGERTGIFVQAV